MSDPRHTGREVVFLGLDSRMAIMLVLLVYTPFAWWSWTLALSAMLLLWLLRRAGYTVPAAARRLRTIIAGQVRPRLPGRRQPRLDP